MNTTRRNMDDITEQLHHCSHVHALIGQPLAIVRVQVVHLVVDRITGHLSVVPLLFFLQIPTYGICVLPVVQMPDRANLADTAL